MTSRHSVTAIALLSLLTLGNRTVPQWQAMGNVALDAAAECAKAQLAKFGSVRAETGYEAEEGSLRFFLSDNPPHHADLATIYIDGKAGFTAMWMDAQTAELGNKIWDAVKRNCEVR